MSQVTVEVFPPLARALEPKATGRLTLVEQIGQGELVTDLLLRLAGRYPSLESYLVDAEGQATAPHLSIFVNDRALAYPQGLKTWLKDGDRISLLPQYVGGWGLNPEGV